LLETYLNIKNKKYILKHQYNVPELFKNKISIEEHKKAAKYNVEKINVNFVIDISDYIILIVWTILGGLNHLDKFIRSFGLGKLSTGVCFFISFMIISLIISIPSKIYYTFYLEEKYGFNKTTILTFILDIVKGILLSLILGVPLSYGILFIMQQMGANWWIWAFAFLTSFQFLLLFIYPTIIAPLFNKFNPIEDGAVKEVISELIDKTNFKNKGIFVMDASKRSSHGNAYFTGFGKNKRIVFFDTLLKTLLPEEIKAVLAHELGHYKKKHVLKNLLKSLILGLIGFAILGHLYKSNTFFYGHGVRTQSPYMALLLFSMVTPIYTFLLTPLFSWLSRKDEFEADTFASLYSNPQNLISSLIKMYKDNASSLTPDPLYSSFYHSHPPAVIRVEFLNSLILKK